MKIIHEKKKKKKELHKAEWHVIIPTLNFEKILQMGSISNEFGTHISREHWSF